MAYRAGETMLFHPGTEPVRGLNTTRHSSQLGFGQYSELQNVRWPNGPIESRPGIQASTPTAPGSGTFQGGTIVPYGTGYTAIAAMLEGGSVRLYANQFTTSWGGWIEITAASGQWGNTRFTSVASDGYLQFQNIPTKSGGGLILVQNGTEAARLVALSGLGCFRVEPIPAMTGQSSSRAQPGFAAFVNVISGTLTFNNSANFTSAAVPGTFGQYAQMLAGAAPVVGNFTQFTNSTGANFSNCLQVAMVAQYRRDDFWTRCRVDLVCGGSATLVTIHDPVNGLDNLVSVPINLVDTHLVAIGIGGVLTNANLTDVRGVRFTVQDSQFQGTTEMFLYSLAGTGNVPGGAQYATAWENTASRSEGPGVVLRHGLPEVTTNISDKLPATIRSYYEAAAQQGYDALQWFEDAGSHLSNFVMPEAALGPGVFIPVDSRIYYTYRVPVLAPSAAEGAKGVSRVNIYRKDPGETEFTFANFLDVVGWNSVASAWETLTSVFGSASAWGTRATYTDVTTAENKNFDKVMPDAFAETVPIGLPMTYANKRLYVGGSRGISTDAQRNAVYASEEDEPFRFRSIARFEGGVPDPRSGVMYSLGPENVRALVATTGALLDFGAVYAYTDRGTYAIQDFQVARLDTRGSLVSSTAQLNGQVYTIDTDLNIREGGRSLSLGTVEATIQGVTSANRQRLSLAAVSDRLYVTCHGAGEAVGRRVLVYNLLSQNWESLDLLPAQKEAALLVPVTISGALRLFAFAPNGRLFEHIVSTQFTDDGDPIPIAIQGGELNNNMWGAIKVKRPGVVVEKIPATMTTALLVSEGVANEPAYSVSANIDLNKGGSRAWRYSTTPTGGHIGVNGLGVSLRLTTSVSNKLRIFSIMAIVEPGSVGADA